MVTTTTVYRALITDQAIVSPNQVTVFHCEETALRDDEATESRLGCLLAGVLISFRAKRSW